MKTTKKKTTLIGASWLAQGLMTLAAGFIMGDVAQAHLSYSGRDLGSYSGLTNGSKTINNQTVTGNYGWADAADGVLGDSHKGRAFRFHLDNTALVNLAVSANPGTNLLVITPAYSIYSGLAAIAPFAVEIITVNHSDEKVRAAAEKIYEELTRAGKDVLFDDRDERGGEV